MKINHESGLTVIKAGTAVVSNPSLTALDLEAIGYIGEDIAELNGYERGAEMSVTPMQASRSLNTLLVASGAVTAGVERLGWERNVVDTNLDLKRVASMVGNSALFAAFEQASGLIAATDLPTHNDLDTTESWAHLSRALSLTLNVGLLPILNEGDARSSEELETSLRANGKLFKRFGDNDWLAAHAASQLDADKLIFLTSKDGVMQNDRIILHLRYDEIDDFIIAHVDDLEASNGGMTSKLQAAKFALKHGVKLVFIGNGKVRHMSTVGVREEFGTTITL